MESLRRLEIPLDISTHWHDIFRFSFVLAVIVLASRLIWKRRNFVAKVNKLPMWKLRFYHFLGHAHYIMHTRQKMKGLSKHAYDFNMAYACTYVLRDYCVVGFWASLFPLVNVQKADAVEIILNSSTELEKAFLYKFMRPWLGNGLLTSHGSEWRNRRKLLTPAFHFNILKDFVSVFNKQAKILVNILSNHTAEEFVDIAPFITRCSFDMICESVLGIDVESQTNPSCSYLNSVTLITRTIAERFVSPHLYPDFIFKMSSVGRKFYKNVKQAHDFTYKLIKKRKKNKSLIDTTVNSKNGEYTTRQKRAFLDLLLDEHMINNTLTEADVREEVDTFTFEGHDTTSMGMCWALYLIGLHPGVLEKIHQELDSLFGDSDRDITPDDLKEMKYLECVLKETLRLYPPVPFFGRLLKQDVDFQGLLVPAGTTCMIFPYMLHRDPEIFPNPEKFDPERFYPENSLGRHPFAYVPFAAGPRNCIGQRFALMEEKTVIATLLRKFKIRSLDPRDKIQVMDELVLRPVEKLRIEFRLRDHKPEKPPIFFYYP